MKADIFASAAVRKICVSLLLAALALPPAAWAQTTAPAPVADAAAREGLTPELKGRTVEDVRILGNTTVSAPVILNVVRTTEGEPYDPATVEEDYKRIFDLRKFSNVEAKVEPTETGVIVVFIVTEQKQITSIAFRGNNRIPTLDIQNVVDIRTGEAIDRFRIALAKQAIVEHYQNENYPYAHVEVPDEPLTQRGELIFNIVEGPNVRVRKVDFVGSKSFTADRLRGQVQTKSWIWIFRPGTLDLDTLDDDVAAVRRFYENKGFFDVRVGRKLIVSPDQSEVQVNFVIEEGTRYSINRVLFQGNQSVSEGDLRKDLRLLEGSAYDNAVLERDVREIVRAYSPFGFIYQEQSTDPDYLRVETRQVFGTEPGKLDLVYQISEGKPFSLGRVLVRGNLKTQDKVILREMRVAPGQLYNSAEVQEAQTRLRSTPYFQDVTITPIGEDPQVRDLLVEVVEARTASFNVGAGVNSNGGIGGNFTYEQKNFDIANWPDAWSDVLSDRAFTGAGQNFRASIEPGTEATNAGIRFTEPWIFDQPYSFSQEFYLRQREREDYEDDRIGSRTSFGKRFNYVWSALLSFRYEEVKIDDVDAANLFVNGDPFRAPEISDLEGTSHLSSVGLQFKRDTTDPGFIPSRGTTTIFGWESFGAMVGDFNFQKLTGSWNLYQTVYEDLLDRKTVLSYHVDAGYLFNDAPFFERFYGGGIGSVRGFEFRGISPRSGLDNDRIGGDFFMTGTVELGFPLAGDTLRGVVFSDAGTVEEEFEINTIRWSVGAGIRLFLPFFGQAPLAFDFAYPISKDDEDDTQVISFSFGIVP